MRELTTRESDKVLLELADLLDRVPEEKFDYGTFLSPLASLRPNTAVEQLLDNNCGTTACAGGFAATLPNMEGRLAFDGGTLVNPSIPGKHGSFTALAKAFSISLNDSRFLFNPSDDPIRGGRHYGGHGRRAPFGHASAKDVAAHIRQFVRDGERTT